MLYYLMEGTPFDLPQILFNCFATEVMKDMIIRKDIYHSVVPMKVLKAHGVTRKFLYETPEEVQDRSYCDEVFFPEQKAFNQVNISKVRLFNDGSFPKTPQVDDSILSELYKKYGLKNGRDDQLDVVWEKAVAEENKEVSSFQSKKRT